MAKLLISSDALSDIMNAVKQKKGNNTAITPSGTPDVIKDLKTALFKGLVDGTISQAAFNSLFSNYTGTVPALPYDNTITELNIPKATGLEKWTSDALLVADISGLTALVAGQFMNCSNLQTVTIGAAFPITSVNSAFSGCYRLSRVNYLGTIEQWATLNFISELSNPLCFAGNLYINNVLQENISFSSNSSMSINNYAFKNALCLKTVTFENNVSHIKKQAFAGCSGLTNIYLNSTSLISILDQAFENCTGITSLTLPGGVTTIGAKAFNGCNNLNRVNYGGTIDNWCAINFGSFWIGPHTLYINNSQVQNAVITALEIKPYAFYNTTGLLTADLSSATSLGVSSFSNCPNLTSVVLNSNLTSIGSAAFYNCSSLTSINTDNIIVIEPGAFYGCSSLTVFEMSDDQTNGTQIGSNAFTGCTSLSKIYVGELLLDGGWDGEQYGSFIGCSPNLEIYTSIDSAETAESYLSYCWNWYNTEGGTLTVHYGVTKAEFDALIGGNS